MKLYKFENILNEIASTFNMDQWNDQVDTFTNDIKSVTEEGFKNVYRIPSHSVKEQLAKKDPDNRYRMDSSIYAIFWRFLSWLPFIYDDPNYPKEPWNSKQCQEVYGDIIGYFEQKWPDGSYDNRDPNSFSFKDVNSKRLPDFRDFWNSLKENYFNDPKINEIYKIMSSILDNVNNLQQVLNNTDYITIYNIPIKNE